MVDVRLGILCAQKSRVAFLALAVELIIDELQNGCMPVEGNLVLGDFPGEWV